MATLQDSTSHTRKLLSLSKRHSHRGMVWPRKGWPVDKCRQTILAQLGGLESKDEKDSIDDVWLAVAIGADDTGEMRVEWTDGVPSVVWFEVLELQLVDEH